MGLGLDMARAGARQHGHPTMSAEDQAKLLRDQERIAAMERERIGRAVTAMREARVLHRAEADAAEEAEDAADRAREQGAALLQEADEVEPIDDDAERREWNPWGPDNWGWLDSNT